MNRALLLALAAIGIVSMDSAGNAGLRVIPKRPAVETRPQVVVPELEQLIDFEDLSAGESVFSQYSGRGVMFPQQPTISEPPSGTRSGTNALSKLHPGDEFDGGPLTIEFSAPQRTVRMFVGLEDPTGGRKIAAALQAFDANDSVVASQLRMLGPGPTPVRTPMGVSSRIRPRAVRRPCPIAITSSPRPRTAS